MGGGLGCFNGAGMQLERAADRLAWWGQLLPTANKPFGAGAARCQVSIETGTAFPVEMVPPSPLVELKPLHFLEQVPTHPPNSWVGMGEGLTFMNEVTPQGLSRWGL